MPRTSKKKSDTVSAATVAEPSASVDLSSLTLDATNGGGGGDETEPTPLTAAAASKPKSKKKKKKPASTVAGPSDPTIDYPALMSAFPITLRTTNAKGRHSVAREPLAAGVTVCLERATTFIVRTPHLQELCHWCMDPLTGEDGKEEKVTSHFACESCGVAVYCSKGCMEEDARDGHALTCGTVGKLKDVAERTDVDVDLLRMVVGLMARRVEDLKEVVVKEGKVDSDKRRTPFKCVGDLVHHRDKNDAAFIKVVTAAAEALHEIMPKDQLVPVPDIVTLACKVNTNAHGLGDSQSRNKDVALGLFPLGALFFNHSCTPNCCFVGQRHGQLAFRTLRPVPKDEELTVSYIDLYAPRDERRLNLLLTKHFWCKCKRCTMPIDKSPDRYLNGLLCSKCRKGVYVIPPSPTPESIMTPPTGDLSTRTYTCDTCGDALTHTAAETIFARADSKYSEGISLIRQRRYPAARMTFARLIQSHDPSASSAAEAGPLLHPRHVLLLNASVPLMNCYVYEGDHNAAVALNRRVLAMVEGAGAFPPNAPEVSDYWFNLGELLMEQAGEHKKAKKMTLQKKCEKEGKQAFRNCWEIRKVAFGEGHAKTAAAEKRM
ncbi:hypothetical protein BC938DRAFT_472892 [Jimgerdemannia flammicorona]|uniref:SET domain-containing protein n=1 Tax=Jimgerdemannia flammicorona TaxID=994334 RepID=A0A433QTM6_9FUNG|nr:hypothetical protein BC938DRAFT_472892 [Jimgerdemannia flammicorona]